MKISEAKSGLQEKCARLIINVSMGTEGEGRHIHCVSVQHKHRGSSGMAWIFECPYLGYSVL